jgi:hypothetical protein
MERNSRQLLKNPEECITKKIGWSKMLNKPLSFGNKLITVHSNFGIISLIYNPVSKPYKFMYLIFNKV